MNRSHPVLRFRDVRVQFDGIVALDLPELNLFENSRLDVFLGPNGAGKSSLINAATGYAMVSSPGKVIFENGNSLELSKFPRDKIVRTGISRTFQMPVHFSSLTVEQSLLLAAVLGNPSSLAKRIISLFQSLRRHSTSTKLVEFLIEELDLEAVAQTQMDELPFVILRRVELARALALQPRILFLDEPSAGADDAETSFLTHLLACKLPEMIRSLFAEGLYRNSELVVGLVTHDSELLAGLARACSPQPMTHYFERGQLKSSCSLEQRLAPTNSP